MDKKEKLFSLFSSIQKIRRKKRLSSHTGCHFPSEEKLSIKVFDVIQCFFYMGSVKGFMTALDLARKEKDHTIQIGKLLF